MVLSMQINCVSNIVDVFFAYTHPNMLLLYIEKKKETKRSDTKCLGSIDSRLSSAFS